MNYGEIIRQNRMRLGLTQRELGRAVGCTDGYIAHIEREIKIPSLDICMALIDVFGFSIEQQQAFLEAVECARDERSHERIRTRGAKVRGALRTRGGAVDAGPGKREEEEIPNAQHIASDLAANPDLREAYRDLRTAMADPNLRETVLKTLRALAQSAKSH